MRKTGQTRIKRLLIDEKELRKVFLDCLYKSKEIQGPEPIPRGAVVVDAITGSFALHPARLRKHQDRIKTWILALPRSFRHGQGAAFPDACRQDNLDA
jgi:hypothetical protein